MSKVPIQFTLNGSEMSEFVESGATLLSGLRDKTGDMSLKGGCHQEHVDPDFRAPTPADVKGPHIEP